MKSPKQQWRSKKNVEYIHIEGRAPYGEQVTFEAEFLPPDEHGAFEAIAHMTAAAMQLDGEYAIEFFKDLKALTRRHMKKWANRKRK